MKKAKKNYKPFGEIQCKNCLGSGLVKTKIQLCKTCKRVGDGCYKCTSGIAIMPWIECAVCIGIGVISS